MDVNALRQSCPLFRGISEEDLTAMLGCLSAREISPRRGDFIMRTPEVHPLMGVVLEGEVEMISEDLFGKKSLLSVLPGGSLFGESYTCVKARRRIIAYQARTHCRVLLLDYDRILHACKLVCRFHHRMIENMVELIAEKNLALVEKLLAQYGADSRVGLVASTVMGSSETIFYTVCVYMSAIDRKSTGYAVPCSLVGALAGTVLAGALFR